MNPAALQLLPEGDSRLLAQFGGDTKDEADTAAQGLVDALAGTSDPPTAQVFHDPDRQKELWAVRESGLGAAAHVPGEPETFPGWEDAAVHPTGSATTCAHPLAPRRAAARRPARRPRPQGHPARSGLRGPARGPPATGPGRGARRSEHRGRAGG